MSISSGNPINSDFCRLESAVKIAYINSITIYLNHKKPFAPIHLHWLTLYLNYLTACRWLAYLPLCLSDCTFDWFTFLCSPHNKVDERGRPSGRFIVSAPWWPMASKSRAILLCNICLLIKHLSVLSMCLWVLVFVSLSDVCQGLSDNICLLGSLVYLPCLFDRVLESY